MTRSTAKVIEDSSYNGHRLTTLELEYPRYIHSEFMTHRVFSRNAQSSRAIPVEKLIQRISDDKWYPIFMKNKAGMQADEPLADYALQFSEAVWDAAKDEAIESARAFLELGVHKQIVNRVLEPYSKIKVIVSGTEWNNFFRLRIHPAAQQEMKELAVAIRDAMLQSNPKSLDITEWHLPYTTQSEKDTVSLSTLKKLSVARCARVSYLNHDGTRCITKDIELHDSLLREKHMSPFEHVATPWPGNKLSNFSSFRQYRWDVENDVEGV